MSPVRVGDREYVVEPFNGRKAILAGQMVARIARKVPGLLETDAQFAADYAQANAIRVTRGMALASPAWKEALADVTEEQWASLNGEIVLPQAPVFEIRFAAVFTEAFEMAEEEVLRLLALTVTPNGDLADAARQGNVPDVLKAKGEELLDAGSVSQLVDLAAAAAERVASEFSGEHPGLGKLRALWQARTRPPDMTTPPSSSESGEPSERPPTTPSPSSPTSETETETLTTRRASSTPSPTPTGGLMSESSIAPRGGSSSSLPTG